MNALIKKLTPEESAAELAAIGCCPICGEKLVYRMCGCFKGWGKTPDEYCPTCQDSRWVLVCPNSPHRGE